MKIIGRNGGPVYRQPSELGLSDNMTVNDVLAAVGEKIQSGDVVSVGGSRANLETPVGPQDTIQVTPYAEHA